MSEKRERVRCWKGEKRNRTILERDFKRFCFLANKLKTHVWLGSQKTLSLYELFERFLITPAFRFAAFDPLTASPTWMTNAVSEKLEKMAKKESSEK